MIGHTKMNSKMIFALLVAVVVTVTNAQTPQATKPNCDRSVMDDCSNKLLMLGDPTFIFPRNLDEMNGRCKKLKGLEKCVKDYSTNCLTREAKQPISVLTYSITRTNKGYCHTAKRKNSFISLGVCANANRKKLDTFMDLMNKEFHAIRTYREPKHRIPMACCSYYNMKRAILGLARDKCKEEETTEIESLLDGYSQDILNIICGDYTEDSDKCNVFDGKIPKWRKKLETKNFLLPLADILNSL